VERERSPRGDSAFWGLMLPMVLYLVTWRLLPLMYTAWLSFTQWNIGRISSPRFIGFANYVRLLSDSRFLGGLKISATFMIGATCLEVMLGVLLALLLRRRFRGQSIVQGILLIPMITSPAAVGVIWYVLYNANIGPLPALVRHMGLGTPDWLGSTTAALPAIIFADVWEWTPFIFILVLSGLQGIPDEVVEAARIDGASGWRIFWWVTLPLLRGVIIAAAILRAMDAFKIFDLIYIMTGGGPGESTESASFVVYQMAFTHFEFGYAGALVIVMLLLTTSLYWLYSRTSQES